MAATSITLTQARRAALNAQLLDSRARFARGKAGVAELVNQLGYIQIDTISVIERAHHHTIWNRIPRYTPQWLHQALAVDRTVFEYWGHAMSILTMSDYRWYVPLKNRYRDKPWGWANEQRKKHGRVMKEVLARIKSDGALTTADFETPKGSVSPWWGWKPAKAALELLFWQGDLMITERRKFQRVYDLTERVLPSNVDTSLPTETELGRFLVFRALNAYAIAEERDIREHLGIGRRGAVAGVLKQMVADSEIVQLAIEGAKGEYYATPGRLETALKLRSVKPRLYLLSPFDNLVIQRKRLERLFNFEYTIECYTPAAKRKYGYFSLPILWGEEMVGRVDCKADRQTNTLLVQNLVFEPGFDPNVEFVSALAMKLHEFADFNGCNGIKIVKVKPVKMKSPIRQQIRKHG